MTPLNRNQFGDHPQPSEPAQSMNHKSMQRFLDTFPQKPVTRDSIRNLDETVRGLEQTAGVAARMGFPDHEKVNTELHEFLSKKRDDQIGQGRLF